MIPRHFPDKIHTVLDFLRPFSCYNTSMKKTTIDLLHGPVVRAIVAFAMPILISNLFQQLYNTADVVIVGRFLGADSLAAVGSTSAIFELLVGFALGVGNGMGIVIARHYGAHNYGRVKQAVAATVFLGMGLSAAVLAIGQFGLYPLLEWLGTPRSILPEAYQYIHLIILGVAVTFAYNLGAGLLRAIGDSLAALYFLIFAAVVNIVLDYTFIRHFHLGVASAGIATIIAQGISAILCFFYIRKRASLLIPRKQDFIWDPGLYRDLIEQGLAMGLMTSIVSIGTVILQSSINALGATIISAQTTARRIMSLCLQPLTATASAMTTFTSQNLGAHHYHRIREGVRKTSLLLMAWGALTSLFLAFASPFLSQLISGSHDPYLLEQASLYLRISSLFYPILALLLLMRNVLQGLGQKITPLISSIMELAGKALFVVWIIPKTGYLGVILCEPIIWIPMTLQLLLSYRHTLQQLLLHPHQKD